MAAGRKPGYLQHQSTQAQEVEILHLQERFIPGKDSMQRISWL